MPECPNCHQYYFGEPDECPKCHKKLARPKTVMASKPAYVSIQEETSNIGNTVQTLALIDLVINAIATLVCAIAFGRDYQGNFSFGWFILILLGGIIGTTIAFIMLYAFGRLVESSIRTEENTRASRNYLEQLAQIQEKNIADSK